MDADDPPTESSSQLKARDGRRGAAWRCPQVASDIGTERGGRGALAEFTAEVAALRETQRHRTQAEVTRFFDGLDLVEPGVVPVQRWRPDSDFEARAHSTMWGGVARR